MSEMWSQKAVAIAIVGIEQKVFNNFKVLAFPQPEVAHIPPGGVGTTYPIDIPPTSSGDSSHLPKLSVSIFYPCQVFITDAMVDKSPTDKTKVYNVGLMLHAVNGTINIGPFFGKLDLASAKSMYVTIDTLLLTGNVTITLNKVLPPTGTAKQALPQFNLKAKFDGNLSGKTGQSGDWPAKNDGSS
ncbi:hypothetical protein BDV96DRAFT_649783 [Lophiotrema nucula]|uniref:Uncharacterized protein n=1 Tax=Lophiotrema nucula TaxID=690887 RepID=A0A6A5YYZ8_9PLEO|nr:hypothetical protein BDV96DRAFT_649783 [Lophiotrema nucula]